ncbi:TPA: hypothetical protein ACKQDM_005636 [Pseudomonas aeruginosa]
MPDMREEFEAWVLREHGLESEWQDERNCFKDYPAHLAFKAWQASRAALRVEDEIDRLKAENEELRRLCSCAKQYDLSMTLRRMIDAVLEGDKQ